MQNDRLKAYPVLLAGGTGTRLWPVSRQLYPKQLIKFIGEDSLIQATIRRLSPALSFDDVRVVCGKDHFHEIASHMEQLGIDPSRKIIVEPCGRNTAPAILLSVFHILNEENEEKDALLCVFPADHVIGDVAQFHEKLASAIRLAENDRIVTFGIKPHYAETGYGYIEGEGPLEENALKVKTFREKPDALTAEEYVKAGNFFWNSGMFVFKASVMLAEFKALAGEIHDGMAAMWENRKCAVFEEYSGMPNTSIDYAIMEKTDKAAILPSDFGWSDIGSWKSLYDFLEKDENGNVIDGDVIAKDAQGCFIMGRERLVAANCIKNLVIVDTPDSVFVSDMDRSKDVKSIVEKLKETNRPECRNHNTETHPWGTRTVLEHKNGREVSRIEIRPRASLEFSPDETSIRHLFITQGRGVFAQGERKGDVAVGDSVNLENMQARIENAGDIPLLFFCIKVVIDGAAEGMVPLQSH